PAPSRATPPSAAATSTCWWSEAASSNGSAPRCPAPRRRSRDQAKGKAPQGPHPARVGAADAGVAGTRDVAPRARPALAAAAGAVPVRDGAGALVRVQRGGARPIHLRDLLDGDPERVPKPPRDGLRRPKLASAHAIEHGDPQRVPKPPRD